MTSRLGTGIPLNLFLQCVFDSDMDVIRMGGHFIDRYVHLYPYLTLAGM